jgi:hypothetical protein
MDITELLIAATVAGPVLAALAAPGLTAAVVTLARTRGRRVKHVDVSGADLFACGVPMTEAQFREMWASFQAALDELPPPRERSEWDMKRQFEAASEGRGGRRQLCVELALVPAQSSTASWSCART